MVIGSPDLELIEMPGKSDWNDLRILRADLSKKFPKDRFLEALLEGVWRVAHDRDNPIRGNLAASALREIVGHMLHTLSPDDEVRKCVWFEQAPDTDTVTRRQKARYIISAGLPTDFVEKQLKIDLKEYSNPLIQAMDSLHKATHVRAETIVYEGRAVRDLVRAILKGILALLDAADEARSSLIHTIESTMQDAVFEGLIYETIDVLDILSTHTRVDGHMLDEVKVTSLTAQELIYEVTGEAEVELQYGSNSDVRRDIGARIDDSYPYKARIVSRAATPTDLHPGDVSITVDTSRFYE